jgi:hypothetical protein
VIAPGARGVPARERQRVIGRSNRDHFDGTDRDALDPGDRLIDGPTNPDHSLFPLFYQVEIRHRQLLQ